MAKSLVLAEKPSVGRDIARVLNCKNKGNGFYEGARYIVTWALGHLVTLSDPESYDSKYQKWNLEDLPIMPTDLKLEVIKQTRGQYNAVKTQLNRKDVNEIIIATDAGREGELVARWILKKSKVDKPIKRLWVSSVTDRAIKEGFEKLKDGRFYDNLYAAAQARSEADWFVGINATRALTCKYNAQLSCGRVQTPTLAMIYEREQEIQAFKSQSFYGLTAMTHQMHLTWVDSKTGQMRTFDKTENEKRLNACEHKSIVIDSVEKKYKKSYAPTLYDLTELQREANKRFGFSAKKTLNLMQKLYEEHKLLTYPRTDSRFLTSDLVETLSDRVRACGVGVFSKVAGQIRKRGIQANASFVDDKKVNDHHAIIPTEEWVQTNALSSDERKIYDMVVKRFLAVLCPPFEYEETKVVAFIGNETFRAKGKHVLKLGWKEVYSDYDGEGDEGLSDQSLPDIKEGQSLPLKGLKVTTGQTQPPSAYTEGTLLTAMEKPSKNMSCGIGTVATRADIIEKLIQSFLIEKRGNTLHITGKGKQLLELVPQELKKPELTAQWEEKLQAIEKGHLKKNAFISDIRNYTKKTIKEVKDSEATFKHDNITREKCPDCGKWMLAVNGKKGKMLVCQEGGWWTKEDVSVVTNARCPECHKKLELRGEGDKKSFYCKCGYKEKLEAFNKRRSEAKSQGSIKDVRKFLQNQKKDQKHDPNDSPFAILLKK